MVFTDTETDPGVVPRNGVNVMGNAPPDETLKSRLAPVDVTLKLCAAGLGWPWVDE